MRPILRHQESRNSVPRLNGGRGKAGQSSLKITATRTFAGAADRLVITTVQGPDRCASRRGKAWTQTERDPEIRHDSRSRVESRTRKRCPYQVRILIPMSVPTGAATTRTSQVCLGGASAVIRKLALDAPVGMVNLRACGLATRSRGRGVDGGANAVRVVSWVDPLHAPITAVAPPTTTQERKPPNTRAGTPPRGRRVRQSQ